MDGGVSLPLLYDQEIFRRKTARRDVPSGAVTGRRVGGQWLGATERRKNRGIFSSTSRVASSPDSLNKPGTRVTSVFMSPEARPNPPLDLDERDRHPSPA